VLQRVQASLAGHQLARAYRQPSPPMWDSVSPRSGEEERSAANPEAI
jgi:hypothetical protein